MKFQIRKLGRHIDLLQSQHLADTSWYFHGGTQELQQWRVA
jgi:hypothetical protein